MMKKVLERHLRPHGLVFDIPVSERFAFAIVKGDDDDESLIGCRPELFREKEFRGNGMLSMTQDKSKVGDKSKR